MTNHAHPVLYPWSKEDVIQQANSHPLAYQVLLQNPEYIRWDILEQNQRNYPIYFKYPEKITWNALRCNPELKRLVQTNITKISWK